jgi:hypothetical protein
MELHEIDVLIEKDGRVRLEVRGMKGAACLAATKQLEKVLGSDIIHREMTPEAAETSAEEVPDRQSQTEGAGP